MLKFGERFIGEVDLWKVLCRYENLDSKTMKSTKAMQVPGGCLVQVTTRHNNQVAEALTFVPGVSLRSSSNGGNELV